MTSREKQLFFFQLAQLTRSGVALPQAAEKLGRAHTSAIRRASTRLRKLLEKGHSASEAFEALRPDLGGLERSTLAGLAKTGRLELGFQRLSDYFGTLTRARGQVLRQTAYPIFIIHLGVLLINVPIAVTGGGLDAYLKAVVPTFAMLYGAFALCAILSRALIDLGARSAAVDSLLRLVPLLGKARRALATSRFCGTLDLQLDAGINIIESLDTASAASRSGLFVRLARHALPSLRQGHSLGSVLAEGRGALPANALDSIQLAEETGDFHRTLPKLREEYEEEGLQRINTAAEWIPRLLYVSVLLYFGWRIISFYQGQMKDTQRQIDALFGGS